MNRNFWLFALIGFLIFVLCGHGRAELLCFHASWCGPCHEQEKSENALIGEGCQITQVDTEKQPELAKEFKVKRVPTTVLIDSKRRVLERIEGVVSKARLKRLAALPDATRKAIRNAVRALFGNRGLEF